MAASRLWKVLFSCFLRTLFSIHGDLLKAGKKSFMQRVFRKDRIKSDLDVHTAAIESEIARLNVSIYDNDTIYKLTIILAQLKYRNERGLADCDRSNRAAAHHNTSG